jgi:hypothetical protein
MNNDKLNLTSYTGNKCIGTVNLTEAEYMSILCDLSKERLDFSVEFSNGGIIENEICLYINQSGE